MYFQYIHIVYVCLYLTQLSHSEVPSSSMGCFQKIQMADTSIQGYSSTMTVGLCLQTCVSLQKTFAAISIGKNCHCTDTLYGSGGLSTCTLACAGAPSDARRCGGSSYYVSIYRILGTESVTSITTTDEPSTTTTYIPSTTTPPLPETTDQTANLLTTEPSTDTTLLVTTLSSAEITSQELRSSESTTNGGHDSTVMLLLNTNGSAAFSNSSRQGKYDADGQADSSSVALVVGLLVCFLVTIATFFFVFKFWKKKKMVIKQERRFSVIPTTLPKGAWVTETAAKHSVTVSTTGGQDRQAQRRLSYQLTD